MKAIFTFLLLALFAVGVSAQLQLPATFENPEEDTAWHQFANAGDLPENFVLSENPDNSGINTSEMCVKLVVLDAADPWVGAWAEAYGSVEITADNYMMEMMVNKNVITDCALKLEAGTAANVEVHVPNSVTDEWELLTFDMSAAIGNSYKRLVFFPDFPDPRTAGSTCYIDNIGFQAAVSARDRSARTIRVYPSPASELITVQYPNMTGITITNIVGQGVKTMEFAATDRKVVEVNDLGTGIYFITLESDDGTVSTKFVKE
jgi:hypothetical protein